MPRREQLAQVAPSDIYRSIRVPNIPAPPVIYGYHNTFHTHARACETEPLPPRYESISAALPESRNQPDDVLPKYICSLRQAGPVSVRCEMSTPFIPSADQRWHSVYGLVDGTQLILYKLKSAGIFGSKVSNEPNFSRPIKQYSLQHAEVGLATDYRAEEAIPRSTIAKLAPPKVRERLWYTDPALFEPVHEWVLRIRLEVETLLLAFSTQDIMLTWVEKLAAAIDIAPPLDDRGEPRYRSIPRRNRRQRQIEAMADPIVEVSEESFASQLVEQQERLFRRLYPHLAAATSTPNVASQDPEENDLDASDVSPDTLLTPVTSRPTTSPAPSLQPLPLFASASSPNLLEMPSIDSRFLSRTTSAISNTPSISPMSYEDSPRPAYDPKTVIHEPRSSTSQLRYRRRCAPILLATSPRSSEIIFTGGKRMRIDPTRLKLVPFVEVAPPKYDRGAWAGFLAPPPGSSFASTASASASAAEETPRAARPQLQRGMTERSCASAISAWSLVEEELDAAAAAAAASVESSSSSSSSVDSLASSSTSRRPSASLSSSSSSSLDEESTTAVRIDSALPSPTITVTPSHGSEAGKAPGAIRKARASVLLLEKNEGKRSSVGSAVSQSVAPVTKTETETERRGGEVRFVGLPLVL